VVTELLAAQEALRQIGRDATAVVLVEGLSDQAALAALGGPGLRDRGVYVVPMGGATNIGHFLDVFGPRGLDVRLAGLCDLAEVSDFQRGLRRAGLGSDLSAAGFFVCSADLEDEMIRALGASEVERLVAAQGEQVPFRTFQKQPAHRDQTLAEQLHRFLGTRSGRKIHYGRVLAEALRPDQVPRPLRQVLDRAMGHAA
jgi:hypothetical protein